MKKLTTLMLGLSLILGTAAFAQEAKKDAAKPADTAAAAKTKKKHRRSKKQQNTSTSSTSSAKPATPAPTK